MCQPKSTGFDVNITYDIICDSFVRTFNILNIRLRHAAAVVAALLQNDIEVNPGPALINGNSLRLLSLNCRGLGKVEKFRVVLSKAAEAIKENINTIIMLQETMIKNEDYIKLAWKGTYAITYGNGNSQGCLTLARNGVDFTNQINIGNRGHIVEINGLTSEKITLINIYAPNGYSSEKRDFFEEVCAYIENTNSWNIILAGDFNLTLSEAERHKRSTCGGEANIARFLSERLNQLDMKDAWQGYSGMTWRRGTAMSRLDRIYTRLIDLQQVNMTTTWTFCDSDHALVQAIFISQDNKPKGPKVQNLNPQVATDPDKLLQLRQYLIEQLALMRADANPHLKLEFAKATIRTKAFELGKQILSEEASNLKHLDEDIKLHERLLSEAATPDDEAEIALHIEIQMNEKNRILTEQGKNLAWKAKTKWYNEGERSNKYFLNLLKKGSTSGEMNALRVDGNLITDHGQINNTVKDYYHKLYNTDKRTSIDDDSFLSEMFNLPENDVNIMCAPITMAELWSSLKPLKDTAPGPDGISHIFLKKLWDILGPLILDAWHYSIATDKLAPSHERSFLRLIPKIGKDTAQLQNWRPITLSNCDHKLITRVYNNRLINLLHTHISKTQTAYIKKRNITDNIRTISAAIQLANSEPDIEGSIIALDAQKAFDSVSHEYLKVVLQKVGLNCFVPIFNLLYKDLKNDIVLNKQIIGQHPVNNGVKQGDALSCTLFILAIEPLIRNIENNENIKPIESKILGFKWPKVLGYADDITCVMKNDINSKQALFKEYENFSHVSGLILNAEKTEICNFGNIRRLVNENNLTRVCYMQKRYEIPSAAEIKINGVILSQNKVLQNKRNCDILIARMDKHFASWSKRQLTILGKIQIYKTFGISQFLYHLTIIEPDLVTWKEINKKVNRFLWNKHYAPYQPLAPARIKKEILTTPIEKGGFGMIDLKEVVSAVRLRRHFVLLNENIHPLSQLLVKLLNGASYLSTKPDLEIDQIVSLNMELLCKKRIQDCVRQDWELEADMILHCNLLEAKIVDIVRPRKRRSTDMQLLRRNAIFTLKDAVQHHVRIINVLTRIAQRELLPVIKIITGLYRATPLPVGEYSNKIKDLQGRWADGNLLTSKKLRTIIFDKGIVNPKIALLDDETKASFYSKLNKLINIKNKSRMLRLLHGDVYCSERLMRFGLSDNDRCRRCFDKETIIHLLMDCPYTQSVYSLLRINSDDIQEVLGVDLSSAKLEIRCDIIDYLVFRQHTMQPEVLIKSTLEKYRKGLAIRNKIKKSAEQILRQLFGNC